MQYAITHAPAFAKIDLRLDTGDVILAQPGSMLTMTTGIEIKARVGAQLGRGFWAGIKAMFTGERFFTAVFTSTRDGERLSLAPAAIGELFLLPLEHGPFFITSGAYLASEASVSITARYGGLKGWLAKKGIFLMHATGHGALFLSSHGAVVEHVLAEGERLVVDNRFVLAFSESVKFELVKATKELGSALMSGEGLVNRYTGPGRIYYQTRAKQSDYGLVSALAQAMT